MEELSRKVKSTVLRVHDDVDDEEEEEEEEEEDDESEIIIDDSSIQWKRFDTLNLIIYRFYCVISLGILPIISFFYPSIRLRMITIACRPYQADLVSLRVNANREIFDVSHYHNAESREHCVFIEIKCRRFCASNTEKYKFREVPFVPMNYGRFLAPNYKKQNHIKLLEVERKILAAQYGPNLLKVPEPTFLEISLKQLLSPFFLFQYFAVLVWYSENYWVYATLILIITLIAVYFATIEELHNLEALRELVGSKSSVKVLEEDFEKLTDLEKNSPEDLKYKVWLDARLLPGDKFLVEEGLILPCDAVLISGKVVVDESMLTGESIPISKTAIEESHIISNIRPLTGCRILETSSEGICLAETASGNVLFAGTRVKICYGAACVAVTYRTGFRSAKGQLVASLIQPSTTSVTFFADAVRAMAFMFILTSLMYAICAYGLVRIGATDGEIFAHYIEAISIAVPPALTACLSISTAICITRLKSKNIFVADTAKVNQVGVISAVCFDKTGTLTENKLNFVGAYCAVYVQTLEGKIGLDSLLTYEMPEKQLPILCQEIMATCHSLALVNDNNLPVGDPLEEELLNASGWKIQHSSRGSGHLFATPPSRVGGNNYEILKHFEFTPERQRAASLVQEPSGRIVFLMKGSPEVIMNLSTPSTQPKDLNRLLADLARKGYRVIAVAMKDCIDTDMNRSQDEIESSGGINFYGLLYLSSSLKADTKKAIKNLRKSYIHTTCITGDHIHTAIAVGRESGILTYKPPRRIASVIRGNKLAVTSTDTADIQENYAIKPDEIVESRIYIIDVNADGEICILNGITDDIVNISLSKAVYLASKSMMFSYANIALKRRRNLVVNDILNPISEKLQTRDESAIKKVLKIELSMTGNALRVLREEYEDEYTRTAIRFTKIFARMKPHDKQFIVETLMTCPEIENIDEEHLERLRLGLQCSSDDNTSTQSLASYAKVNRGSYRYEVDEENAVSNGDDGDDEEDDDYEDDDEEELVQGANNGLEKLDVLFCGDGANDMVALRAATIGLSLCEAETSVAAPITSKTQGPSAVIEVIAEGRATLITAYSLTFFTIMYGAIQLFMTLQLFWLGLIINTSTYIIQDIGYTLILGIAMSYAQSVTELSIQEPPKRFLSLHHICKLISMMAVFGLFQMIALSLLKLQPHYHHYETNNPLEDSYASETTTLAAVALAQLMIASVVSSIDKPFRQHWTKNKYHTATLSIQIIWLLCQIFFSKSYFFQDLLGLKALPSFEFSFVLVALMVLNLLVSYGITVGVDWYFVKYIEKKWYEKTNFDEIKSHLIIRGDSNVEEAVEAMDGGGTESVQETPNDTPIPSMYYKQNILEGVSALPDYPEFMEQSDRSAATSAQLDSNRCSSLSLEPNIPRDRYAAI